jgi:hypothetical protein
MGNEKRITYVLIPEVDAAILERLPKEGARLGIKPLGSQVKAVAKMLSDEQPNGEGITGAAVGGRMGTMLHYGFAVAVTVQPVGTGKGYQVTSKGEQFVQQVKDGTFDEASFYEREGSV